LCVGMSMAELASAAPTSGGVRISSFIKHARTQRFSYSKVVFLDLLAFFAAMAESSLLARRLWVILVSSHKCSIPIPYSVRCEYDRVNFFSSFDRLGLRRSGDGSCLHWIQPNLCGHVCTDFARWFSLTVIRGKHSFANSAVYVGIVVSHAVICCLGTAVLARLQTVYVTLNIL
jgi:hypothetical protein